MNTKYKHQLLRNLRVIHRAQTLVIALPILLFLAAVTVCTVALVDYDANRDTYTRWEDLVLSDNYVVADNLMTDISKVTTPCGNYGYSVAYNSAISVGDCRTLAEICRQTGVSEAVAFQTTLPDGTLYWSKVTTLDLKMILLEAELFMLPDGEKYYTNTPPQSIGIGPGAWLHARAYRAAQDWIISTHKSTKAWLATLVAMSIIAVVATVALSAWLYSVLGRARYRNRQLVERISKREAELRRIRAREHPGMVINFKDIKIISVEPFDLSSSENDPPEESAQPAPESTSIPTT